MSEETTLDGRNKVVKAINGRIDALEERLTQLTDSLGDRLEALESSCSKAAPAPAPVVDALTAAERNELNQLRQFRAQWIAAESAKGAPKMEVEPPQQPGQTQPPRAPRIVTPQAIVVQRPNA
jgi:hypothetical protein